MHEFDTYIKSQLQMEIDKYNEQEGRTEKKARNPEYGTLDKYN